MPVVVKTTPQIKAALSPQDLENLVNTFAEYKDGWPAGEDWYESFGKDGGYTFPQLTRPHQIQHVHLKPAPGATAYDGWVQAFNRCCARNKQTKKISNRVLVYARDADQYLLIYILDAPDDAHEVAKGLNSQSALLMNTFKQLTEAFIFNKLDLNGQPYP